MKVKGIGSTYFGKAGHLFVMSELLLRGWNVAIPEIDQGDDIFVVRHGDSNYRRMQVKSANALVRGKTISVQYSISKLLLVPSGSEIDFVFVVRHELQWKYLFIISSDKLRNFIGDKALLNPKPLNLTISISSNSVIKCRKQDFGGFLNNFSDYPHISHSGLKQESL